MVVPPDPVTVELRTFEPEHLALVRPWFEHPEVRRRLGGPEWPERALRPEQVGADEEFRGRRVLRSHTWLAWDQDVPVGYIGGEVYDRWARYDGSDPDHPVVSRIERGPAMGSAFVVDPARRSRGYGRAMLLAWVAAPEVSDVRVFALGIDHDNLPSARCALAAGFVATSTEPDWEGTVYHLLRRGVTPPRRPAGRTSAGARSRRSS